MSLWKRKCLAFLHDPPHKPFAIAGHEEQRASYLSAVGLSPEEINQWRSEPDWFAAAADRFPFPKPETLSVDWKEDEDCSFRHPLAGERWVPAESPRQSSAVAEDWLLRTLEGIGTEEADWQKKFFLLWRFWSERAAREWSPLLAYLVADTRIPDHTIWHHNAITAAFETAGNQAAFLLFQIGPVQEFIAQARRMIDLWSGSFLLSFLISQALAVIALEIGPDCIIYPSLRGAPLLDWRWKESRLFPEDILTLGKGRLHYDELLTPSLPNRFLALVPGERGQELARKAEEAVRSLWQKIHKTVYQQLCQKLEEVSGMTEAWDQT